MRLLIIGLISITMTACTSTRIPKATVKITNLAGNSGGSGVIVSTSKTESKVLTNGHVCEVAKFGGLVHTMDDSAYFVASYKKSQLHDVCEITIMADLHESAPVAKTPPGFLSIAIVSGHPRLLPNIITIGHFSKRMVISVMTGTAPCTPEDTDMFCVFLGFKPIIKTYPTIAISATIQPGSSGSPVFNTDGEVAALIFAGSGEFGYGFVVPQEYIYSFVTKEVSTLASTYPEVILTANREPASNKWKDTVLNKCNRKNKKKKLVQCQKLIDSLQYDDLVIHANKH